ncbi:VWFA-related domain-containing protein [Granulicella rosea]|uniref:VWFA-related domain-containing protein n=1 Tax=Granulicella rosea TaxID=474952 RepID=A0A239LW14_9BACT|nr:VWA domain-containing protein [Granulicella rosea]SNT34460.1 VWFA-related domain-containing protein [Granulicella rosea]
MAQGTQDKPNVSFRRWAALLLLPVGVKAVAQQPAPTDGIATLSVKTQLVTVDVTVNDTNGHPVLDLGKADFAVRENGTPQRIRYFSPPSEHRMPSTGELVRSSADLNKIGGAPVSILVLDEINTPFTDMSMARGALERYLKTQPEILTEPTALFFVSNSKLDVIEDYTQNKAAIQAALKKHFPDYPWQLTANSGDMALLPRMSRTLGALVQIAEAARGIKGRKNVVWVGKGFPSIDVSQTPPDSLQVITDAIKRSTFALLESKVSLFTIDPSTLDPTPILDQESDSGMAAGDLNGTGLVFGGAIQFQSMAGATGGHAYAMNNFIDQEIASGVSDGANYYELGYSPTQVSDDPAKYRKIAISVTRPGTKVIARDGYFPSTTPAAAEKVAAAGEDLDQVKFDLSTAALSKLAYNGLAVTAQEKSAGQFTVSIAAEAIEWREAPQGHIAELSVLAVCFSAKDKPVCKGSSEHTASTTGDVAHLKSELTYKVAVDVPSSATRIRFVVRDVTSGKVGSADLKIR